MCTVSDKLKLCTCKDKTIDLLNDRWTLYRHNGIFHFGGTVRPELLNLFKDFVDIENRVAILQRINEPDVFDKSMGFMERDRLVLTFDFGSNSEAILAFEFRAGKWVEISCEQSDLMYAHDSQQTGPIKQTF